MNCQLWLEVGVILRTRGEQWAWTEVFRTKLRQVLYMLENCTLLGFYEAHDGCSLPTFPGLAVQRPVCLTHEDGTDMLSLNVGNEVQMYPQ